MKGKDLFDKKIMFIICMLCEGLGVLCGCFFNVKSEQRKIAKFTASDIKT